MAGTKEGGAKVAKTMIERHGPDYYRKLGSLGGKASNTGGFAQGEIGKARASKYGKIGGAISRRRPAKKPEWME